MSKFTEELSKLTKELELPQLNEDMVPPAGSTTTTGPSAADPMAQIYSHPDVAKALQIKNQSNAALYQAIAKATTALASQSSQPHQQAI